MDVFSDFPDPRCQGKVEHLFIDILVIAVCASWTDIEQCGQRKKGLAVFISSEKREIIAIDSQSLRHSFDKKIEQSRLHGEYPDMHHPRL
ncbi:transposase family protein [Xenorhabdus sp. DI]|uniref:hypothetical protein n=1 Tax=Xenorhabdus doucetiae TaxID=351671 RepID=UPI0019B3717B|nr:MULTISPECIES: hypothetical protein [unclassified Xenorhabdus]MBD2786459.1 transposase family protein [Xenorhabdus sp. 3]MBD2789854.1 transposase family protein [Xenorhabdus sp. DI]MBD2797437.1 transposase family protein [Xenorhabdus sp. 18]